MTLTAIHGPRKRRQKPYESVKLSRLLARTLKCRKGCGCTFREEHYRLKHEREFHDERAG
jgi:hypothetical protein